MRITRHINKHVLLALLAIGILTVIGAFAQTTNSDSGVLLTGTVTAGGQKTEGIVVSAQAAHSPIITSVYTDESGNYYFPKLAAGSYKLWAQTGGYATGRASVQLSGSVKRQDLALVAMKDPEAIGKQMTGPEWLQSLPAVTAEDQRAKEIFRDTCTGCHGPGIALQNRFDAKGWEIMISRMQTTSEGHGNVVEGQVNLPFVNIEQNKKDLAAYLAKVRGPESTFQPKFRPRPKGEQTLAVIREYIIPTPDGVDRSGVPVNVEDGSDWSRGAHSQLNGFRQLHDSTIDFYGNIWFTSSQYNHARTYGKVNIKTGKVTFFNLPGRDGASATSHAIARDPEGYVWMNVGGYVGPDGANQSAMARVDPKTDKLTLYAPPKGFPGSVGSFIATDTKNGVWMSSGAGMSRLDTKTFEFRYFKFPHGEGPYGVTADVNGNGWGSEMSLDYEGRADIETGMGSDYKIPPGPRSEAAKKLFSAEDIKNYEQIGQRGLREAIPWYQGPRRPGADQNPGGDSVWVPGWWGGTLMKINIYNYQITQYPIPAPDIDGAYDIKVDKDHMVWVSFQNGDIIGKFDPKAEKWTEYRLPTLNFDQHAIGYLDGKDGKTQITIPSFSSGKVVLLEPRTKQEQEALKAEARNLVASK